MLQLMKLWNSNNSTWHKFHNKHIIQEGQLIQEMAFK